MWGQTMNNSQDIEILYSYCSDSRVHALIDNPTEDSIDGNWETYGELTSEQTEIAAFEATESVTSQDVIL